MLMMARKPKPPRSIELPEWVCINDADRERFKAWTNARLDEIPMSMRYAKSELEQALEEQPDDPCYYLQDQKFVATVEQDFSERLKRGRVIEAAKRGDTEAIARLADTEELRMLAFRIRHNVGREKGEGRPRDYPLSLRLRLEAASNDVDCIYQIWKQHFGKRNRTMDPTAGAIAARRHGVSETELINFRKNRHRRF
jgi:hypothetical protein